MGQGAQGCGPHVNHHEPLIQNSGYDDDDDDHKMMMIIMSFFS